jgi:hypothetical protein
LRTCCVAVLLAFGQGCGDGEPGTAGEAGAVGPSGAPGAEGDPGDEGEPGDTPDSPAVVPSLAACFPSVVYLGHPATLTVSGRDTSWSDPQVDFGDGISIASQVLASPTAIVAEVEVDLDASPGSLDVAVVDASSELVLEGVIDVMPSLEVVATRGTLANGSSFVVDLAATDPAFPLDEASLRASLSELDGLHVQVVDVGPWNVRLRISTDVGAGEGELDVVVQSGEGDTVMSHRAPGALSIARREPIELDLAAPPVEVDADGGSHLYVFESPEPTSKVVLTLTTSGGSGAPTLVVLPASGDVTDFVATGATATFIAAGEGPWYVVVYDDTAATDYTYDLAAVVTPSPAPEAEPNDACDAPGDAVTAFPTSLLGAIADDGDEDWFAVTIGAAQDGLRLRSRTVAGDPRTDVELTLFDADCTTALAGPRDIDFHENLLSGPLPEGDVFLRVRPSQLFPNEGTYYELTFSVEP